MWRLPHATLAATLLTVAIFAGASRACSNFILKSSGNASSRTVVSGRTMDFGLPLSFGVATVPQGSQLAETGKVSRFGFVGAIPVISGVPENVLEHYVNAGMNTAGLSCDQQTLLGTVYPNKTGNASTDISVDYLCEYVLAFFEDSTQLARALSEKTLTPFGPSISGGAHFVVRDAQGLSLVVEFIDGATSLWVDKNDGGESGFGVLTNEPNFQWHIENVRHAQWKLQNARPAFTVPGAFYPDERFLRIHLLKSALPIPTSNRQA